MIIPKKAEFNEKQLQEIQRILNEYGVEIKATRGSNRTIYAMMGDESKEIMLKRLEGLDYVERVDRMQIPYKLMTKNSELAKNRVQIGGKNIEDDLYIIAGHCTIDPKNPSYFIESAHAIKEAGGDALRGGVWKPRSSPHSYQGDAKAIEILIKAKEETGLPVNTEVMDGEQLSIFLEHGCDILQIGARNALNYYLLKIVGNETKDKKTLILLKRSLHMGPVDEFILAAEYVVSSGNPNICLCPRGTIPKIEGYRNHPDESIIPLLREKTWAPIISDPSHSVGKASYVPHTALASVAYGANGLNIECNIDPKRGIGDDPKQAVTPEVLGSIIKDCREIYKMAKKYQSYLN